MRALDFVLEDNQDSDRDSNIVTVLSLIQDKVKRNELKAEMPTQFVLRMIRNTGLGTFDFQDLMAANNEFDAIQNILKQLNKDTITFVSDDNEETVTNTQDIQAAADNPQQTVSNMAKQAAARRQKPLI